MKAHVQVTAVQVGIRLYRETVQQQADLCVGGELRCFLDSSKSLHRRTSERSHSSRSQSETTRPYVG